MNKMKYKKLIFALASIHKEIEKFVKQIVMDSTIEIDIIHYKIGLDEPYYKIGLFNSKTGVTAIKHYDLIEFMTLCSEKKIEMELNITVRKLLLETEGKEKGIVKI